MTASDPIIALQGVRKSFGSYEAIHGIDMTIGRGEFFSLLGPSGCGKTTLLRMLAGFESTTAGEIVIDGQPMSDVPPHLRPVNMVFQNYAIFPHLNVRDNIAYGLRRARLSRARRAEMVEEMLELVKLPGFGGRRAHELSGGQRQRIALARALIMRPKVLLLDEPLGALDKRLREQMQIELRRLQRAVGITFVFVTHDQEEALTLSDRIAVMSAGRVLQVDTPSGLYERPRTRTVADFIGTMNVLGARVVGRANGHARLEIEALGTCELPASSVPASAGDSVCLGIRPERFAVHADRPGNGAPTLAGTVEATTYLGERSHLHVRVPGLAAPLSVSAQNTGPAGALGIAEGRPVWLSWHGDALIVLQKD